MTEPTLYIVVPCYNEEAVLPETVPMFLKKLHELMDSGRVGPMSRILFVNDGSRDGTWALIRQYAAEQPWIEGLCLSRNRGHQNALLAGLMTAKEHCDITISIDCDGQDDMNAMDEMVDCYQAGADIVYGVRSSRETDTLMKRFTAQSYYKLLRSMGAEVVYNHADYRLVSARVLREFEGFKEVNIYLRGMFPLVGFQSTSVYYERHERIAGESHYPIKKMLSLALNGITSLSIRPIRLITGLGAVVAGLSFIMIIWVLISYFTGNIVPGWSSSVLCTCLLGGIQLLCLGIIGEYIGKIYMETKARPRFIISESTLETQEAENKKD